VLSPLISPKFTKPLNAMSNSFFPFVSEPFLSALSSTSRERTPLAIKFARNLVPGFQP
jgi:hypothetical protein